ncbi:unnamed protein product [Trichobilharzia regenti]|nr:unnamed protein product [Trichobilharzia regenti]
MTATIHTTKHSVAMHLHVVDLVQNVALHIGKEVAILKDTNLEKHIVQMKKSISIHGHILLRGSLDTIVLMTAMICINVVI